jgi:zinc protease
MRRTSSWLAVLLALVGGVCLPAEAADAVLGAVETVTLRNGLRLVLAPDAKAKSVDVAVWYDAGSRYDQPGKTGAAHLFEHLMFRGSSHFGPGEHARLIRAEGGTTGAYATHDFISLHETLPPDALELAFRLEADRMAGLQLTQAALDAERRQVGEERRRTTAVGAGLERLYGMAFPGHPYGVSMYGRESDLEKLTVQDLRAFYRSHFGPASTVVTVVGSFQRDQAVAWARKYLEPIKGASERSGRLADPKVSAAEQRVTEPTDIGVRVLLVGWRVPARNDPAWPALSVLSTLLTRGNDAPITKSLVLDRPLCWSVQGDVDSRRDASMFYVAVAVAPGADSAEVERVLLDELERAGNEPMSESDLERAKRQTETGVWFGLQTTRGRARSLGVGQALAGDPRDLERMLAAVRACTPQDLQRAAQRLGAPGRKVVWMVPRDSAGSGPGGRP